MPLQRLKFKPGIDRSNTNYANEGGFFDCDKVRFRSGTAQKIGGWISYMGSTILGSVRGLFNWVTLDSTNILAIGTNIKYYVEHGGSVYDITPLRASATLSNPFATTAGSTTVTVSHMAHGAANGDYVTFSVATDLAGITFNREFQLTYVDADHYTIEAATAATATTTGGGSPTAAYQITVGKSISSAGRGWGAGAWGRGTWGSPATQSVKSVALRLWSQESFGEDHLFCIRNDKIYLWRYNNGVGFSTRATALLDEVGATDVPVMATKLLMSTADRHLIAFGCNAIGSAVQDPLLIRWASAESYINWTIDPITTTAGELRCSSGNYIVTAVRYGSQTLVFTDATIFSMQYVGAPLIFGMLPVGDNISIISPHAAVVAGSAVFWMGTDKFYVYNGQAQTLPCTLMHYIFDDFNQQQTSQVFAGSNEAFSEVWWFYCSSGSNTIDRYVVYNYAENLWYPGTMHRTAWVDSHLKQYPVAASDDTLFYHEAGYDDNRTAPINAWIETSDFDLGDGESFSFVKRVIPDVEFSGSTTNNPSVTITITPRNSPGAAYKPGDANAVARSTSLPYDQYTERLDVRLRGRQLKFRIESTDIGVAWQLGVPRIEIQPDGKKS